MKTAVTTAPRNIELLDEDEPSAGAGEAIVEIEAVGVCGSDIHLFLGDHPYSRFPVRQGHELAGVVTELNGPGADGVEPGARVAIEPYFSCGECYPCRRGRWNCCVRLQVMGAQRPGGLAERVAVPVGKLYPVGGLDAELTAMVEPVSIGEMALDRGSVAADDSVVIFGAGPIGMAILLGAGARGARTMVVDIQPSRLELAGELGADLVVLSDETLGERVRDWTGGEGPGVVFDATGVPAVIRSAVELVAAAGRVVVVGLSLDEVSIPVVEFTRKELTVLGARAGLFGPAVELIQQRPEHVRRLITHRFGFEEVQDALTFAVERPGETEKVMVLMPEPA